ncbi:hypothetical protein SAMN05192565_1064 [Methylobacterium gossipiicola]|uniref:Uncharacterized protein n=1 Tax=Methylobacterium gossipiicola TaxID=582675 RepID=A0A1I2SYL1_9HYPH|nr:hypothetical protein SAMN05192565_1064 [Methylobacterium gossipiicola]
MARSGLGTHPSPCILYRPLAGRYRYHSPVDTLDRPCTGLDGDHTAIVALDRPRAGWYLDHTAVSPLHRPCTGRDGDHTAIVSLDRPFTGRYLDHTSIVTLYTARARPDGHHMTIGTLEATSAVGNGHGHSVRAGELTRHRIPPNLTQSKADLTKNAVRPRSM